MTEGDRAGTLANAIRHLGDPEWRKARTAEISKNRLDDVYAATRQAIMALPADRWLTVSEVAVLFHRVETIAFKRLDAFKGSKRYKEGQDYRKIAQKIKRADPLRGPDGSKLSEEQVKAIREKRATSRFVIERWVYRREAVREFWDSVEREEPASRKKVRIESPTQKLHRQLEATNDRLERLERLIQAKLGWLTKDGMVFDNADLPQAPVEDIRAFLAAGGSIESMTLGEAMMSRTWLGYTYRKPWAELWKHLLTEATAATDQAALLSVPLARDREPRVRS